MQYLVCKDFVRLIGYAKGVIVGKASSVWIERAARIISVLQGQVKRAISYARQGTCRTIPEQRITSVYGGVLQNPSLRNLYVRKGGSL